MSGVHWLGKSMQLLAECWVSGWLQEAGCWPWCCWGHPFSKKCPLHVFHFILVAVNWQVSLWKWKWPPVSLFYRRKHQNSKASNECQNQDLCAGGPDYRVQVTSMWTLYTSPHKTQLKYTHSTPTTLPPGVNSPSASGAELWAVRDVEVTWCPSSQINHPSVAWLA